LSDFLLPHARFGQPLLASEPTPGTGAAQVWRPGTPALATGLTDHGWRVRDVLRSRVPPWSQLQAVDGMRQNDAGARARHTAVPTLTWRAACGPDHLVRWV